jgi:hypothetical protein
MVMFGKAQSSSGMQRRKGCIPGRPQNLLRNGDKIPAAEFSSSVNKLA